MTAYAAFGAKSAETGSSATRRSRRSLTWPLYDSKAASRSRFMFTLALSSDWFDSSSMTWNCVQTARSESSRAVSPAATWTSNFCKVQYISSMGAIFASIAGESSRSCCSTRILSDNCSRFKGAARSVADDDSKRSCSASKPCRALAFNNPRSFCCHCMQCETKCALSSVQSSWTKFIMCIMYSVWISACWSRYFETSSW
mmetsp:Transcript_23348/g.81016  ORF Transcript_23348/g.81016 Transcript_23348/m.81016 type:complete len:200 (+) Transcript_23348:850-1449(+)